MRWRRGSSRGGARQPQALRPEIQALRAIAASMVVLFHFWPAAVPGGYAGVDVFFVISGYLITAHLMSEKERTGRIRLGAFYARRARRLLPAAYLVIFVSVVAVVIWVPNALQIQNFREARAAAAYFENWQLASDAVSYLAQGREPSVVQHYWTLSVEEQFYLVWPLFLMLAISLCRRLRGVGVVVAAVMLGSFAYSYWMTGAHPAQAYFVSPGRVWEFGLGACLVFLQRRLRWRPAVAGLVMWLGAAMVVGSAFVLSATTAFPGTAALLPTVGAALVISAGSGSVRFGPMRLFRVWVVRELGEISYAVYLWHWPLIIVGPHALHHALTTSDRWIMVALTVLLAEVSTRTVERWFRTSPRIVNVRPPWILTAAALVLALASAGLFVQQDRAEATARAAEAQAARTLSQPPRCLGAAAMAAVPCHNPDLDNVMLPAPDQARLDGAKLAGCFNDLTSSALLNCTIGDASDPRLPVVAVLGDSHAFSYLMPLKRLAEEHRIVLRVQLMAACAWVDPVPPDLARQRPLCTQFRQNVSGWLRREAAGIDVIFTTGRWDAYPGGTMAGRVTAMAGAWRYANSLGIPVVGLVDEPRRLDDPTGCLILAGIAGKASCAAPSGPIVADLRAHDPTELVARGVPKGRSIDLTSYICGPRECPAVIGGVTVYRDISHLTDTFIATLAPYLYSQLEATGYLVKRR